MLYVTYLSLADSCDFQHDGFSIHFLTLSSTKPLSLLPKTTVLLSPTPPLNLAIISLIMPPFQPPHAVRYRLRVDCLPSTTWLFVLAQSETGSIRFWRQLVNWQQFCHPSSSQIHPFLSLPLLVRKTATWKNAIKCVMIDRKKEHLSIFLIHKFTAIIKSFLFAYQEAVSQLKTLNLRSFMTSFIDGAPINPSPRSSSVLLKYLHCVPRSASILQFIFTVFHETTLFTKIKTLIST